jgi:energy-coupling factor transporter transmembrane protein EcfT
MVMYKKTQTGWVTLIFIGGFAILMAVVAFVSGELLVLALALLFVVIAILFASLTVTVDRKTLKARFGPGPIVFTYQLSEITSAKAVRNSWLAGWGMHWCGDYWLYNVHGFGAVEITLTDGRKRRIGTGESDELKKTILKAAEAAQHGDTSNREGGNPIHPE